MNTNTPSSPQSPDPTPPDAYPDERLSIAAALSFLCVFLAVSGCIGLTWIGRSQPNLLVYMVAVPTLAFSGVILGVIARKRIARSGGVLRGRGLATIAIFVGILGGIIPTAFILSALVTLSSLRSLSPVAERVALASASPRPAAARSDLSPDANADLTDARLAALGRAIERAAGKPLNADVSIGAVMEARTRVASSARSGDPSALGELSPKPVVIRCASGSVIAYALLDEDALNASSVLIDDALFLLPDGSSVTLRADGPAQNVARALGVTTMTITE